MQGESRAVGGLVTLAEKFFVRIGNLKTNSTRAVAKQRFDVNAVGADQLELVIIDVRAEADVQIGEVLAGTDADVAGALARAVNVGHFVKAVGHEIVAAQKGITVELKERYLGEVELEPN